MFIELQILYMKIASSEHVVYKNCFLFWCSKQFLYTTRSELAIFLYWTCNSMNNLSSYSGLTDSRMSASYTDLPVICFFSQFASWKKNHNKYSLKFFVDSEFEIGETIWWIRYWFVCISFPGTFNLHGNLSCGGCFGVAVAVVHCVGRGHLTNIFFVFF